MRGAGGVCGINMGKSLKAKKRLKLWLAAKKKREQELYRRRKL